MLHGIHLKKNDLYDFDHSTLAVCSVIEQKIDCKLIFQKLTVDISSEVHD
jgi:hypothetical protein